MRKKFSESQIVAAIRKQESGISTKEISRELGISEATFYNWKAKYGGIRQDARPGKGKCRAEENVC